MENAHLSDSKSEIKVLNFSSASPWFHKSSDKLETKTIITVTVTITSESP